MTGERAAQRFAPAAARLAGLAGAVLGWRPDEFWRATPDELGAVIAAVAGAGGSPDASASDDDLRRLQGMFPDG